MKKRRIKCNKIIYERGDITDATEFKKIKEQYEQLYANELNKLQ